MDWLADATRNNPPRPGFDSVRVPGDRAVALREEQRRLGVRLHATIPPLLQDCGRRLGVAFPDGRSGQA
jgi:LDH2 family malate/lactate/ureidoglycolate dehydrogenase